MAVTTLASPVTRESAVDLNPRSPLTAKVRIALVGCGAAARELHMPVLSGHDDVEIAALVDRDAARAKELARAYRVGTVLTNTSQLSRDVADAAILCTPPSHHACGTIDLLRKGLHVMVEKPMATRYEDAEEMVRVAEEAGLTLVVTVFRRLLPVTRLLRGLLDAELLGRVLGFEVEEGEVYNWPTATLANMCRDLAGGGVLIDFGSHTFDRLLSLFDGPGEILEYRDNSRGGIESDCEVRIRLTHKGRPVEGRVELSRTRNLANLYSIRCERGTFELKSGERFKVMIRPSGPGACDPLTKEPRPYTLEAGWNGQEVSPWYEAFRAQLEDWLAALRAGRSPTLSGASVLPSLKLIGECYRRSPLRIAEPWTEEGLAPMASVHAGHGSGRRVLITGATGFIGGRVAEVLALREGWQVRALVHHPGRASRLARLPVEMVVGDLSRSADPPRLVEGCDAIVHCAMGTTWGDRKRVFEVTVGGTRQLVSAALNARVARFVHLSTIAVHNLTTGGVIDETTQPNPPSGNDYAESKAEADRIVTKAAAEGLCAVTLRLANVYGPFSTIFTTRPASQLARNRLVLVGPATELPSSTVYVDNVVEAIVCSLLAPATSVKGEVFTVSEGDDFSWADFFGYFAHAAGASLRAITDEEFAKRHGRRGRSWLSSVLAPFHGAADVVTSAEMWGLTKRVLKTEPLFGAGQWMLSTFPPLRRRVFRWLGTDAPSVYRRQPQVAADEDFEFELTRRQVSNVRARSVLGFAPTVSRARAMELTLEWLRHARILK